MSDIPTLGTIRANVRFRADMVNSQFCTDAEINGYIQASYKELYDLLVEAVEDYNLISTKVSITSGNTIPVPTDMYKLRGIDDLSDAQNPKTVRKFMFGERNEYLTSERMGIGTEFSDILYRIVGSNFQMMPPDRAVRSYQIWYVNLPTVPVSDSDTIDVINGFDEYITVDAAMKCKIKEESDIRDLTTSKSALTDRIYRMRSNRDQSTPDTVTRIRNRHRDGYFPYLIGTDL